MSPGLSFYQKQNHLYIACPAEETVSRLLPSLISPPHITDTHRQTQARPGNVFVFELFHLKGDGNKTDRAVAWGTSTKCTHFITP